jgi:hypothetical protein
MPRRKNYSLNSKEWESFVRLVEIIAGQNGYHVVFIKQDMAWKDNPNAIAKFLGKLHGRHRKNCGDGSQ